MDFRSPPPVIDALRSVADFGFFGYSSVPDSYFESVTGWMKRRHDWEVSREWIAISPGVVPALNVLVGALTQPGDQVILQTPVYYPFFDVVKRNGREILDNPLKLNGDLYEMDLEDLERKITPRTSMIILCNPHNPVCRVWGTNELKELGRLCLKHNIVVVSDEIHSDLVYQGYRHIPFMQASDEFRENLVTCTAASKTFNLPGLQTSSIIISNPGLKKRFTDAMMQRGMPHPAMFGVAATEAAYRYGEEWLEQLLVYLQGNIDFLREYAAVNIPGLKIARPQGTYLMWLDFRECGIQAEKLGGFVREDAKVATQAGLMFGGREAGFERMNIACPRSMLKQALEQIAEAAAKLRRS